MLRILAVTNMYPNDKMPFSGTFVEQQIKGLEGIGLTTELLYIPRDTQGVRAYLRLRSSFNEIEERFQPDIVHIMYGGFMAEAVTRIERKRPVVVSFCGSDLLGSPSTCICRGLIINYGVLASRIAAKRADGIIVKSGRMLSAFPRSIDLSKVRVIPSGIDLEIFKPLDMAECRKKLDWEADFYHVLFPSSGDRLVKRYSLAALAIEKLKGEGIPVKLHQLKDVPHRDVPVWINASDALIFTSSQEGSPNVIKEALACNRPIVSIDVGDVRELIEGIEGCYLACADPVDLADKLKLLLGHAPQIDGRRKMQGLSLERIALRIRQVYDELLLRAGRL